jgi:hypothetical protein
MLLQMAVFACVGVAFEVVFTAFTEFPKTKDKRLMGSSYVWMFPIYALIPVFLGALYPRVGGWNVVLRLGLYVFLLLCCEYASGWALRKATGECPWERNYYPSRWSIHGLIRLDYIPSWALACFLFERLYLSLRAL